MKIISYLMLTFALTACNKAEQEIIIVPQNFTGHILIVFNKESGDNLLYQNGKRIYKIPANGVLKTKFSPNSGWMKLPEFYYDNISSSNRIVFKPNPQSLPIDSVVAYGGTAGSVRKENSKDGHIRFLEYYIGNKSQIDKDYNASQTLDINKLIR